MRVSFLLLPLLALACDPAPPLPGEDRHTSGSSPHTGRSGGGDTDELGDTAALPGDTDTDGSGDTDTDDPPPDETDPFPVDTGPPWVGDTDLDTFWQPEPEPVDTDFWLDTDDYAPGKGSCVAGDVRLGWVFPGNLGRDWTVVRYPDVVPGTGVGDWTGARGSQARAQDEHFGTDVAVPNFRWMDANFPVRAVADGVVIEVRDGHPDRNTTCTGDWNAVTVRHLNGFTATYGHLKRGSLKVRKGDPVQRGQTLAVVGSSGCSTQPQVHLELRDCGGAPVDPWSLGLFDAPPPYRPPLRLMDAWVVDRTVSRVEQAQDPGPDATVLHGNRPVTYGITLSGGQIGDTFAVDVRRPDGVLYLSVSNQITRNDPIHHWWWSRSVGDFSGTWTMEVTVNGRVVAERAWEVVAQASAFAIPEADLADVIADHVALGLQPVWLDVYGMSGQRYYNLLSEPSDRRTEVWWGVDALTHEANAAAAEAAGLRLVHVDATDLGDGPAFVGIAAEADGTVEALTDVPAAVFWNEYDTLQDAGMRPRSLVELLDGGGSPRYTAVFDDEDVGTYVTVTGILRADFSDVHSAQRGVGRNLTFMDARNLGADAYLVGVWADRTRGNWTMRTVIMLPDMETYHEDARQRGFRLRAVTGYARYGDHRLAAFWSER